MGAKPASKTQVSYRAIDIPRIRKNWLALAKRPERNHPLGFDVPQLQTQTTENFDSKEHSN